MTDKILASFVLLTSFALIVGVQRVVTEFGAVRWLIETRISAAALRADCLLEAASEAAL